MIVKRLRRHSGAILLTVIIMTLVLSAIVVSIMSINVSQVKTSQSTINDIKAEYLAEGYYLKYQAEKTLEGDSLLPSSLDHVLDQKNFEITGQTTASSENDINVIQFDVTF